MVCLLLCSVLCCAALSVLSFTFLYFLSIFLSLFSLFVMTLVINYLQAINPDLYLVVNRLYDTPAFWLVLALGIALPVAVEVALRAVRRVWYPNYTHLMQELGYEHRQYLTSPEFTAYADECKEQLSMSPEQRAAARRAVKLAARVAVQGVGRARVAQARHNAAAAASASASANGGGAVALTVAEAAAEPTNALPAPEATAFNRTTTATHSHALVVPSSAGAGAGAGFSTNPASPSVSRRGAASVDARRHMILSKLHRLMGSLSPASAPAATHPFPAPQFAEPQPSYGAAALELAEPGWTLCTPYGRGVLLHIQPPTDADGQKMFVVELPFGVGYLNAVLCPHCHPVSHALVLSSL
jgi:hypothetical protein